MYSHDLAGTRYSPLTQINTKNVANLKPAWTYRLRSEAERNADGRRRGRGLSEVTPIVVNGVMYLPAGKRVVALEPETGKEIWTYTLTGAGNPSNRGVSYWPGDQNNPPRIIFTAGRRMIALNAKTGKVDPGFGKEGEVDLVVPYNSPPTIYKNFVFVGANVPEQPATGQPGNTRAYDARTGAKLWEFHSVPQPGEPGHESWQGDDWKDRTGVNNWGFFMTVDTQRGMLYTTFGSPASDFYGFDRAGNDLFGNSVVAIDVNTGKMKWYFQAVHHDLWDMDLPPAPPLLDVTINGKKTPILAQTGKLGYMYMLNRETGEPVFGIKETPVAKSQVPGEHTSPTQPIPVKPPQLARHQLQDGRSGHRRRHQRSTCQGLPGAGREERSAGNDGPFTPWVYRAPGAPPTSSVIFPGAIGGANWGGSVHRSQAGLCFREHLRLRQHRLDREDAGGSRVPYDQRSVYGDAGAVEILGSQDGRERSGARRAKLAVPETAMGPAHRGQRGHGRHRLAGAPGRHR